MNTTQYQQDNTEQFPDGDAGLRAREIGSRESLVDIAAYRALNSIAASDALHELAGGGTVINASGLFERRRTADTPAQIIVKNLKQPAPVAVTQPSGINTLPVIAPDHVDQTKLTPDERYEHMRATAQATSASAAQTTQQPSVQEALQKIASIHELQLPLDSHIDRAA